MRLAWVRVKLRWKGQCLKSLVWPDWGPLLHALSFSGKAVHLAVDSVSDSHFAVSRCGLVLPSPGRGQGWGESARGGRLAAGQVRRELTA
jgi:hypothetical protein